MNKLSSLPPILQQSNHIRYNEGHLQMENILFKDIARQMGTPCYCYSKNYLQERYELLQKAFSKHPTQICYAVKANSTLAILSLFAKLGSGFDVVSGGEMARVLKAGGDSKKIVFSGVGKTKEEIIYALKNGVGCINIESESELVRINEIAKQMNIKAPVSFRVNPDVDANTHPYISTGLKENKFGIPYARALEIYKDAAQLPNVIIHGIDCHIGSQLTEYKPFLDAFDRLIKLIDSLKEEGVTLNHIDLGGGFGVVYEKGTELDVQGYAEKVIQKMEGRSESLMFEPGRFLVANSGVLITTVEYIKKNVDKNFAVVDAAMNDLMRPCLYKAYHAIVNTEQREDLQIDEYDIVGPVCESADFLGKERSLDVREGDILAVLSAGAYTSTMASNYNTRGRAPEVLVDGDNYTIIRKRETFDDQIKNEIIPSDLIEQQIKEI